MKKVTEGVKLNLTEIIALNFELQQLQKEQDLTFALKYDLVKMMEETQDIVSNFNKQKMGVYKKYGKCTDEAKEIYTLDGADGEIDGIEELTKLVEKEEVLNASYKLADFKDLKSNVPYVQIMKFIK